MMNYDICNVWGQPPSKKSFENLGVWAAFIQFKSHTKLSTGLTKRTKPKHLKMKIIIESFEKKKKKLIIFGCF